MSALSIKFDNQGMYKIPTGQCGPPDGPRDILITENGLLYEPEELHVTPEVQIVGPQDKVFVTVSCSKPPWFLYKGMAIAQFFLLPHHRDWIPENPIACWVEAAGPDKPMIECCLLNRGSKLYLQEWQTPELMSPLYLALSGHGTGN